MAAVRQVGGCTRAVRTVAAAAPRGPADGRGRSQQDGRRRVPGRETARPRCSTRRHASRLATRRAVVIGEEVPSQSTRFPDVLDGTSLPTRQATHSRRGAGSRQHYEPDALGHVFVAAHPGQPATVVGGGDPAHRLRHRGDRLPTGTSRSRRMPPMWKISLLSTLLPMASPISSYQHGRCH
jgi:hypothetical protein